MRKKDLIIDGYFIEGKRDLTEDEIHILKFWVLRITQIPLHSIIPISKRYHADLIQRTEKVVTICKNK